MTLRTLKIRDAEQPLPLHLIRRRVELAEMEGDDLRRGPVTSCVIEPDRRTREDRQAAQKQVEAAEERAVDLKVLRILRDHPALTSRRDIREHAAVAAKVIDDSIGRILCAGWARAPEKLRQPYVITEAGRTLLGEGQ